MNIIEPFVDENFINTGREEIFQINYIKNHFNLKTFKKFRNDWVKATTFGFMSFLLMVPCHFIFVGLFHPPQFEGLTILEKFELIDGITLLGFGWGYYLVSLIGHFVIYLTFGVILAQLQYAVLKQYIPSRIKWTVLTIFGIELVNLGDLFVMGLSTGGLPGPWEPLLIGLGGRGLIAFMQFLYLRSLGIKKGKWVGWWILGIVTGIPISIILVFIYEYFLIESIKQAVPPMAFLVIDWLSSILPYFALIGFFAGLFSAKPLYRALNQIQLNNEENGSS